MKRFLLGLGLAFFVAACDDDESCFVRPGDEDSSSSVIPGSSGDLSSSSVRSSSSAPVEDLSSSSARSSSSAPVEDLSSSSVRSSSSALVEDLSSSSVRSSSSAPVEDLSSSSSAKSSSSSAKLSSSAKSSSSSVSSSSEYVPFDHTVTLGEMRDQYKKFTDERNGRSYYYITIRGKNKDGEADSVTVMAENLNIGTMITYVKDQADDTTIERYCYDRDTTNCDRYGALYQWAEMMQLPSECNTKSCADQIQLNHQGICPDGWRLLTQDDFYIVLHADGNTHGIEGVRSSYGFNGYNSTGYSLVGAGYVWNRQLKNIGEAAGWFYTDEGVDAPAEGAFVSSTAKIGEIFSTYETKKTNGLSVRCVMVEKQTE